VSELMAISVINQKGGVGKTTTTINLAAALAARGKRVLVVDADPQGTATTALAPSVEEGAAELLGYGGGAKYEMAELVGRLVVHSPNYGCDIVGANFDRLSHQEIALTSQPELMPRFLELLEAVDQRYDFVLFDCPPALRALTTATMYAADYILLVVEPSKESIDGLGKLLSYLAGMRRLLQHDIIIAGAVVTKADPRERLVQAVQGALEENERIPWVQAIYNTVAFKDAYVDRQPISAASKTPSQQRAAADVDALAERILALAVVPA